MNLTDTHAHLYWDSLKEDLDNLLQRAKEAGVSYIINIGVDVKTSKKALEQAKKLTKIKTYSTIGIHPHEALRQAQGKLSEEIEKLEQIYRSNPEKVVGVGECGLDYLSGDKNLQKQLFQAQINLAKKLNLPLIVHCREAWDDTIKMTKDYFGIYHCYSGQPEITEKVLKTNFLISFAGNLTYPKNEYLREAANLIPLERIALETDCPFLPPQGKRGEQNEPSYILETAVLLADLKRIPIEDLAIQTTANAKNLLKIA